MLVIFCIIVVFFCCFDNVWLIEFCCFLVLLLIYVKCCFFVICFGVVKSIWLDCYDVWGFLFVVVCCYVFVYVCDLFFLLEFIFLMSSFVFMLWVFGLFFVSIVVLVIFLFIIFVLDYYVVIGLGLVFLFRFIAWFLIGLVMRWFDDDIKLILRFRCCFILCSADCVVCFDLDGYVVLFWVVLVLNYLFFFLCFCWVCIRCC